MVDLVETEAWVCARLSQLNILMSRESNQRFLSAFVQQTGDIFGIDRLFVGRMNSRQSRVQTVYATQFGKRMANLNFPLPNTPDGRAIEQCAPVFNNNCAMLFPP
jgi:hypothetical protein